MFSQGDFRPVAPEGHTDLLAILDERSTDLVKQNGRLVNQPHAVLRELLPGGIERDFATEDAPTQLKRLRPETAADAMRKNIALEIVGDLRRIRFQIDDLTTRIKTERAASGTQLPKIPGVGTVTAARILARTGNPTRFANEAAYASYTGTAPVEVASADKQRHQLSRSGDRSLNAVIHIVAVTKPEHPAAPDTLTTNGKWPKARPHVRPCDASNGKSRNAYGAPCATTSNNSWSPCRCLRSPLRAQAEQLLPSAGF
ncbi:MULTISPECIES: transposase [unclassified Rhodococcus (in: high G+C Gram-positive bacteria)]|uniref:transposase n=1 Tax=unclassified Rhodococcus (in: high G+C Gram-positive bacteria) TaxID=192944 RepID=UPI000BE48623|nr:MULTISPECIES: transposase [unclassified Rhodococcus (in: high G+C Gram-positive bacteria)]MBP1158454.1 hypothetical protein [Rhodococcus sp. PvR099]